MNERQPVPPFNGGVHDGETGGGEQEGGHGGISDEQQQWCRMGGEQGE